ncbi:F0F1 ATP synthase subunit B [Mangrovicoccus algicola]|uniref:ATP synthase subunit b n=1 Tax=Mangrovicoccus algicola TaxID=2771008 RepID=A0A8J6YT05_9RHOB|nr:F0F1 ATP synthase subunit B [Mangrovicoccus algicola]MBE3636907.1 F0F1 ATP synthase subunit B [Mangrovicoccus algicola]
MTRIIALALTLAAGPALAADGPFFSLHNTNFVVLLAFLLFVAILVYFKVPGILGGMLDKRADGIRTELAEAKALREEAQALLASYKRKQDEMAEQAQKIVETARKEAKAAAAKGKADLDVSIARRLAAAEEQIAAAEKQAVKEVRDEAVNVAVAAAGEVIAKQMDPARADAMFDDALGQVQSKLH